MNYWRDLLAIGSTAALAIGLYLVHPAVCLIGAGLAGLWVWYRAVNR